MTKLKIGIDCKGASCYGQPWNEVPLLWGDLGISMSDLSVEEYYCADEANIVERHPDYAWVWKEQ
jgi:hypothetical protein